LVYSVAPRVLSEGGLMIGMYGKYGREVVDLLALGFKELRMKFSLRNGNVFTEDQVERQFDLVFTDGLRRGFGVVRDAYLRAGVPVVVADMPHFRVPGYHRLSLGSHEWSPKISTAGERLRKLTGNWSPFESRGPEVLVLGQVGSDSQHGKNDNELRVFYDKLFADLRRYTKRPIRWRPHPEFNLHPALAGLVSVPKIESLDDALSRAWCAVTYNSTAGIQALFRGVPVFSFGPSPYGALSTDEIWKLDDAASPDQRVVISSMAPLAYTQWSESEIKKGRAINFIIDCVRGRDVFPDEGDKAEAVPAPPLVPKAKVARAVSLTPTPKRRGRPPKRRTAE